MLEHHVEQLEKFGFTQAVVVSSSETKADFDEIISTIQSPLKIHSVKQGSTYNGQAAAVFSALEVADTNNPVLVINLNDIYTNNLLQEFVDRLPELVSNQHNCLTGYYTKEYFPGGYLILDNKNVIGVKEKPGAGNEPSNYVRLVFDFIAQPKLFLQTLSEISSDRDDLYEVALSQQMKSQTFELIEYQDAWHTLKYPWHVLTTMAYFLENISGQHIAEDVTIADNVNIMGDVVIESGCKIFPGATINGPVYLGKNTIVGNNALVRNSMVGEHCVIGYGSEVARSYLRDKVWLHMNYVGDSIFDSNVSLGSTTVTGNLRFDEKAVRVNVKGELISSGLSKLGAIVGLNVRTGIGALLMPGVRVGSNSMIGAGVVLNQDLPDNSFVKIKQELDIQTSKVDISGGDRDKFRSKI